MNVQARYLLCLAGLISACVTVKKDEAPLDCDEEGSCRDSGSPPDSDAGGDAAEPDCPALGEQGTCRGDTVVYCKGDERLTLDCASVSATCGLKDGRADCASGARAGGCGDVTGLGTCNDTTLSYCDSAGLTEVISSIACKDFGQNCSPDGATDMGAICVPWGECPVGLDDKGACQGNELRFCEEGELYRFDCGSDTCGEAGDGFFDCFTAGAGAGCGSETAQGRCEGGTLVRCVGDVIAREDCGALGLSCGADGPQLSCRKQGCATSCPTGHTCDGSACRAQTPVAEWTFMVYVVGDNNLSSSAWDDLNEMETVGSSERVHVTAQVEFSESEWYSRLIPESYRKSSYRLDLKADQDPNMVTSLVGAQDLGDLNMSAPKTLADFVRASAERHPAKHYALTVWDHGTGWQGGFIDDGDDGRMSLRDLVDGIRDSGVHLDILDFDACLMGMHEVAMAFRGVADVMIASEEVEPGAGNPYAEVLVPLTTTPTMDGTTFAQTIVNAYGDSYPTGYRQYRVTKSALRLDQASAVNDQIGAFSQAFRADLAGQKAAVINAFAGDIMRFEVRENADLVSVLKNLSPLGGALGSAADGLRNYFTTSSYVLRSRTQGGEGDPAGGTAIFLPVGVPQTVPLSEYRKATSFLPLQPWTELLASFEGDVAPSSGDRLFAVVLSWADEPGGEQSSADLDLHVYEPDGTLATPGRGTVSPNGFLSADSLDTGLPVESYELKAQHARGSYVILAHYYGGTTQAYPTLTLFDSQMPDGQRTLARGKIEERKVVFYPMDKAKPVDLITSENLNDVIDLDYSDVWYAAVIEVP